MALEEPFGYKHVDFPPAVFFQFSNLCCIRWSKVSYKVPSSFKTAIVICLSLTLTVATQICVISGIIL